MSRRHHYRRLSKEPLQLDVTTFLNLMVVLVPFLLVTAVFSRLAIVELNLPSATGGRAPETPAFRVEVIVREDSLQISNGTSVIAQIPNVDGEYDLPTLSDHMVALKRQYSDVDAASVLLEPQIPYDYLIRVMDVVQSVDVPGDADQQDARAALFTDISIGEAP
jgi:biopolymer transport protein ExbD